MQRSEIRGNAANGSTGPGLRFAPSRLRPSLRAKRSNPALSPRQRKLDCFVALLLAMTGKERTLRHRFARRANQQQTCLASFAKKFFWNCGNMRRNRLRAKSNLLSRIKLMICPVQSLFQKYSASRSTQITSISLAIPSHTEGRFAIVTDVGGGMRWTQLALLTNSA